MINKKSVFFGSIFIALIILVINYFGAYNICNQDRTCALLLVDTIQTLFIFIPILILSLVTYKMRDEVFHSWLKFAYVWVPLTIVLTFLAPEYDASLVSITKGVISFVMSTVFLLVSLVIIFVKYRKTR